MDDRTGTSSPLRIGIINVMPHAEDYERYLLRPLRRWSSAVDISWIRLESHAYSSSDRDHIAAHYRTFARVVEEGPLDGMILTGAPVEDLPYEEVTYWSELQHLLGQAERRATSTLGICWGAMALAKRLGVDKVRLPQKLFGVFANRSLFPDEGVLSGADDRFWCAHSRHAGILDEAFERAQGSGALRLLAHGAESGYTIFESPDRRFVGHLGHPEYEPARLVEEWRRDLALGRADVGAPHNLDPAAPVHTWRSHGAAFFLAWLSWLEERRGGGALRRAVAGAR